jgi:hypothetical protein
MPGYKYPNIDSGATPIGSAGRAPYRKRISRKNSTRRRRRGRNFWAYDRLQVSDHSLGGYSHRERWSRTRWRITSRRSSIKNEEENFESMDSTFHSHRESGFKKPDNFGHCIWSRSMKKPKIYEVEDWRNQRSRRLKKSKIKEVEVWRSRRFEVWRLNPSLQLELSLGGYWRGYALQVPAD